MWASSGACILCRVMHGMCVPYIRVGEGVFIIIYRQRARFELGPVPRGVRSGHAIGRLNAELADPRALCAGTPNPRRDTMSLRGRPARFTADPEVEAWCALGCRWVVVVGMDGTVVNVQRVRRTATSHSKGDAPTLSRRRNVDDATSFANATTHSLEDWTSLPAPACLHPFSRQPGKSDHHR